MARKTEHIDDTPVAGYLYDADSRQTIPLEIEKSGRRYRVSHTLEPLSDDRWYQLERERDGARRRITKDQAFSTAAFAPNSKLWQEIAVGRAGYAERDDWRAATHIFDRTQAVSALLSAVPVPPPDEQSDILDAELLADDEYVITLQVMQSGVLMATTHFLREETTEEMDQYLAIQSEKPGPFDLPSAAGSLKCAAERLAALYDRIVVSSDGYTGRVPAWHKAAVAKEHFGRQFLRMGKSSG